MAKPKLKGLVLRHKYNVTVIAVLFTCVAPLHAMELTQLLDQVQAHFDLMGKSVIRGRTEVSYQSSEMKTRESLAINHTVATDGIRFVADVVELQRTGSKENEEIVSRSYDLWDGQKRYKLRTTPNTSESPLLQIDSNEEHVEMALAPNWFEGSFWRGTTSSDSNSLSSILKQNQSSIVFDPEIQEDINGIPCYRLHFDSKDGERTIWVAKNHSNIMRAEIALGEGNEFNGQPITDGQTYKHTYDVKSLLQVDGQWIPAVFQENMTVIQPDGAVLAENERITTCLEAQLAPDFDSIGVFVPDIPDGVEAHIVGYPYSESIKFLWDAEDRDVKPVENTLLANSVTAETARFRQLNASGAEDTDEQNNEGENVIDFEVDVTSSPNESDGWSTRVIIGCVTVFAVVVATLGSIKVRKKGRVS